MFYPTDFWKQDYFFGLKTRRLEVTSLRKNFKSPHFYHLFQFLSALSTLFERFA